MLTPSTAPPLPLHHHAPPPAPRICRFPVLIEQTVDELYHQMQGLATLLGVELTAAVRQAYKVPALAAQKPEDLDARMDTLSEVCVGAGGGGLGCVVGRAGREGGSAAVGCGGVAGGRQGRSGLSEGQGREKGCMHAARGEGKRRKGRGSAA